MPQMTKLQLDVSSNSLGQERECLKALREGISRLSQVKILKLNLDQNEIYKNEEEFMELLRRIIHLRNLKLIHLYSRENSLQRNDNLENCIFKLVQNLQELEEFNIEIQNQSGSSHSSQDILVENGNWYIQRGYFVFDIYGGMYDNNPLVVYPK